MTELDLRAFDPSAVFTPESVAIVEKKIAAAPKKWARWRRGAKGAGLGCLIPLAVGLGGSIVFYLVMMLTGNVDWESMADEPIAAAVTLAVAFSIMTFAFIGIVASIVGAGSDPRGPEALARVLAFARDNDLVFSPESTARDFHGRVWDEGTTYRFEHLFREGGIDYGSVGRADKHGVTQPAGVGYLAIKLERKLPHIVLMRRRGARAYVGDGPEFALEGDFGTHFELHVPPGYETDALYVLTPDVMQTLIDEAADQRVEIVDDYLFVFGPPVDVTDAATHARMHRIAAALTGEIVPQTDAYRDERVRRDPRHPLAVNRVAPGGRRLGGVVWVPGVLLAIAVGTAPFWGMIAQAFADAFAR